MAEILKNRLQELRFNKNLTQEELANMIGVTRQTIIAIEKGNYTPSVLLAINLANVLKTKVEEVFFK